MRILLSVILAAFLCAQPLSAAQSAPDHKPTKEEKAAAKEVEKRAKLEKKEAEKRAELQKKQDELDRKQEARARRWREQNPEPEALKPAYPLSLRPEFNTYARQTAAAIDNAFNTIQRSQMEFAMANQMAQQYLIALRGGASNQGEAQVAEAIAAYGQLAPVCQQALWDAASNLIALFVFNRYPGCIRQATFLRSVADLTMRQNFQPASAPPSTEALKPAPPGGS